MGLPLGFTLPVLALVSPLLITMVVRAVITFGEETSTKRSQYVISSSFYIPL